MPSARPQTARVTLGEARVPIGGGAPLVVIAGPCVIESREHCLAIAAELRDICERVGVPLVFKASFDKANRTAIGSYRGPGLEHGLAILAEVREATGLPVLSDIHLPSQAARAAEHLDCIQIPAFLCRQTDLLVAAAEAGKPVNLKKGQFMAPEDMAHAAEKVRSAGNEQILITERGTSFGYRNLVVDFRSLAVLARGGQPVIFDATHSVQQPGALGGSTGGTPEHVPLLARAAVAVGVDAVFLEVHEDPAAALSDGANALPLAELPSLLATLRRLDSLTRGPSA